MKFKTFFGNVGFFVASIFPLSGFSANATFNFGSGQLWNAGYTVKTDPPLS